MNTPDKFGKKLPLEDVCCMDILEYEVTRRETNFRHIFENKGDQALGQTFMMFFAIKLETFFLAGCLGQRFFPLREESAKLWGDTQDSSRITRDTLCTLVPFLRAVSTAPFCS